MHTWRYFSVNNYRICHSLLQEMFTIHRIKLFQLLFSTKQCKHFTIRKTNYQQKPFSMNTNRAKLSFWSFHFDELRKFQNSHQTTFSVIINQSNVTHFMSMNYKSFSPSLQMSSAITFAVTGFHCCHSLLFQLSTEFHSESDLFWLFNVNSFVFRKHSRKSLVFSQF